MGTSEWLDEVAHMLKSNVGGDVLAEQYRTRAAGIRANAATDRAEMDPSTRIHLMDVTVVANGLVSETAFWRGAPLAVDGWHLGDLEIETPGSP